MILPIILFFIMGLGLFIRCAAQYIPKRISKQITIPVDEKIMHISSAIRIDGYYRVDELISDENKSPFDTISQQIIFYENGSAKLSYSSIPSALNGKLYISDETCGIYKLANDTIVLQWVYRMPGKWGSAKWDFNEEWYKILDKEHILLIKSKTHSKCQLNTYPARFIKYEPLPTSDCWLGRH